MRVRIIKKQRLNNLPWLYNLNYGRVVTFIRNCHYTKQNLFFDLTHPEQGPLDPFVEKKREKEVFWNCPGTLTGLATEFWCLLKRFCKNQHAAPKTVSLDHFCLIFLHFHEKIQKNIISSDLGQNLNFGHYYYFFLLILPQNDPAPATCSA